MCIDSIKECTDNNHEIILVDNGSTDETALLSKAPDMQYDRCIINEENLGFPKAVNQGVKAAKGDYVCILNNDVIVTPNWLNRLMAHLEGGFDAVGPCSNFVAGAQRVQIGTYDNQEELHAQAESFYEKNAGTCEPVNWIIGFCMVLKKELFIELGGFDEDYGLGNSEDIDFCFKAKKTGCRIGIARDVYIHHFGHVTHEILELDIAALVAENNKKFYEKWGQEAEELLVGQTEIKATTKPAGKPGLRPVGAYAPEGLRILVGTYFLNKPQGTQTWTYTLIQALRRRGHEVVALTFAPGYVSGLLGEDKGIVVWRPGGRPPHDRDFDLTITNHYPVLRYIRGASAVKSGPIVHFVHGVGPKKEQPVSGADYYVAVSEEVKAHVEGKGYKVSAVIPNFVDLNRFKKGPALNSSVRSIFYVSHYQQMAEMIENVCKSRGITLYTSAPVGRAMFVEEIMWKSDVVITLGRGICEAMACGRAAFVGDHSPVIGRPIGDGFITGRNFRESMKFNFNGKRFQLPFDEKMLSEQLDRYTPAMGEVNRGLAEGLLDVEAAIDRIFELALKDPPQRHEGTKKKIKKT